eukprot:CAMPEP_0113716750 /NCGR_PEP_ID=MMETSP0038_2-20120614/34092_1 /TAXON_ID=2898 /ORGANISM="Cryptomonas paramecium" /LENGTH=245 /DNA_ID=CAMNT_0000644365 /DNA_START=95 /DNA_END=831 /DNA_ORIENTATION=+ /assembly_acc=CAM_ASM_000170
MIYGGMCFDEDFTLAHFLIMGILNHEREGKKLTAQIEESKGVLKAFNSSDKRQKMFLVAMELYIMKERPKGISRYNEVLKKLWESDIVEDEQVEWWQNTENTLQQFSPEFNLDDAVVIRESGLKFLEWLREGDDARHGLSAQPRISLIAEHALCFVCPIRPGSALALLAYGARALHVPHGGALLGRCGADEGLHLVHLARHAREHLDAVVRDDHVVLEPDPPQRVEPPHARRIQHRCCVVGGEGG